MQNISKIRKQFFKSLIAGTGECFLILKENPEIDFSDLIYKASIINFAYDPGPEGSRADFIYKLIINSKQKNKLIKKILKKLKTEEKDFYALQQMSDLAVQFFNAGYIESKSILYYAFENNQMEDSSFFGEKQLIELFGLEGIFKIAEVIGKKIYENSETIAYPWFINDFQKKNKSIDVNSEIKKASKKNKYIKFYYNSIINYKLDFKKPKKIKRIDYKYIKEKIMNSSIGIGRTKRVNELTNEEVEKLASEFLVEKDKKLKEKYLSFFKQRKFPFDYKQIFEIAKKKNKKNPRFQWNALESLKFFSSKEIREYALEKIKSLKNPCDYLCLLTSNYKKGDYKLLVEILNRRNDYHYIHSLVYGFIDIYEVNKLKESKAPLELIYSKMNCGMHRADIVKILFDNKVLSQKILNEIKSDSYYAVRKLYKKFFKTSKRD